MILTIKFDSDSMNTLGLSDEYMFTFDEPYRPIQDQINGIVSTLHLPLYNDKYLFIYILARKCENIEDEIEIIQAFDEAGQPLYFNNYGIKDNDILYLVQLPKAGCSVAQVTITI